MESLGILIVGAGPAGSSCAWALRRAGLNPTILDKNSFPRDKICGGWITPAVLAELQIDPADYSRARTLQPITGFRTSSMGGPEVETRYGRPISFGIRRCEFDDYLLKRSGARIVQDVPLKSLERSGNRWIVNGEYEADLVIGAGGHFCPVARALNKENGKDVAVVAQEIEFEMTPAQRESCSVDPEIPELFFCRDMKGYGWCFRKGNFLNVGLGRLDSHALPTHVAEFEHFLNRSGKVRFELPASLPGHAYLLYANTKRNIVADGALLIGDAAGLAYSQSGEGIRPAVESGLLAAKAIIAAQGQYNRASLQPYRTALENRFGKNEEDWTTRIGRRLPAQLMNNFAKALLASGWFSRHIVLDRWFLHRHEPALSS
jgi:menaquinone-9 beta-reductase